MSKRSLAANLLRRLGVLHTLEALRSKPGILIATHHRIGNASASRFDRALYSASTDELDQQLKYFKRHFHVVDGEELEAIVSGKEKLTHMSVAITFDDGYIDDYLTSFNILKSNDCTGFFFLVSEYVGTNTIPWWDEIAYRVRNTKKTSLSFQYPVPLTINLTSDRQPAIRTVLSHYKRPDNHHGEKLLEQLRLQTECELPITGRRFINWEETREMQAAGMTIGSHTRSHRILGQLSPEDQWLELSKSKKAIEEGIGSSITSIAYPVGIYGSFNQTTERIAQELGYRLGFSFYGGVNTPQRMQPTNLLRMATNPDALLFRAETLFLSRIGWLPY
ncbi:polysaccharide deacetylase family protein [Edaphobacter flagellatus]|uniref:polysaccharide deacetylase family protein n=1 Tax=Edaphobacter flagellatus TaxID=1933044 RepID=UPI0021B4789F|nr:polysaccharide deacetylase family protein [Edaphobacter flagellatus]